MVGLVSSLVAAEVFARIWVAWRWPPERIELLTTHSSTRGRFNSHPNLPFTLNPAWPGHNALGFRGPLPTTPKPKGTRRVACIGASTTYGLYVTPEEAFPAQLAARLQSTDARWEAINAGVPGYVSTEILTNLVLRVLPLEPDVVVIMEGRNEVFPQAYNAFQPDYTHYRRPGFNYLVSNYAHKHVFRCSRLAMLLCTVGGERFGWSEAAEHPLYGGIVWENRPNAAQLADNLGDPARASTWQRSLESMVAVCQARGIRVLLCTMAFRRGMLALDELPIDAAVAALMAGQVERNNGIVREVAAKAGVAVVETATLQERAEVFVDDCHVNAEGHRLRAEMVVEALLPLLDRSK